MKRKLLPAIAVVVAALAWWAVRPSPPSLTLLNVSYDPTRELYRRIGERFAQRHLERTGQAVAVRNSHGGSGAQARAVMDGLKADIVSLALGYDVDAIAERGLIRSRPLLPYTSTIVFLVREGNPKKILDWDDVTRSDVSVVMPNPKTSGGARWTFIAAWGQVLQGGGTEANAEDFMRRLYLRVPVLDAGARAATSTFVQKGIGDVLITWENEAYLALGEASLEIVYPERTVIAEPPVALVDAIVDARGTRAIAQEFVEFLFSPEGQEIISRAGYRPANGTGNFPSIRKPFTIAQVAGTWKEAHRKFFADGAAFDRICAP